VGAGLALLFPAFLDVAAEFRYDIRLCRFAPDQLSFAFAAYATCFAAASFRQCRSEETESIADASKMSNGQHA